MPDQRLLILEVWRGEKIVQTLRINTSDSDKSEIIKLGSLKTSQIVLDANDCARMHAVIEIDRPAGTVHVIDLGTVAGTVLNGLAIDKRATAGPGDVLKFGNLFQVHLKEEVSPRELAKHEFKVGDHVQIIMDGKMIDKGSVLQAIDPIHDVYDPNLLKYLVVTDGGMGMYFGSELGSLTGNLRPPDRKIILSSRASVFTSLNNNLVKLRTLSGERSTTVSMTKERAHALIEALTSAVSHLEEMEREKEK